MDLKKIRADMKISQAEMARRVGVHLQTYLFWERGVGNPNKENFEKLMRVIGDIDQSSMEVNAHEQ